MRYNTLSHSYMKSLEFYENYITIFCLEKTNFLTISYLLRTMHGLLPKVFEWTIQYKQQLRNNTILSRALFRNAQQFDAMLYGAGVAGSTIM